MPAHEPLECVCGEPLAAAVTGDALVTAEGERVPFRRHTDFVVCPSCLSLYRAVDLQAGVVRPVGQAPEGTPPHEGRESEGRREGG